MGKNMLDIRLKMIYDLLPDGTLCDVGTDHGKLPVFAVKSGKCKSAVATDLRKGPLSAAKKLVYENGLEDRIALCLSNGFLDIPDSLFDTADCFVMAGMGGELIMNIISARKTFAYLVLQPQSAVYELTEFLQKNGYNILKRTFCKDKERIYTAFVVKFDGKQRQVDLFYGCEKTPLFYEYLEREKSRVQKAVDAINASDKSDKSRLLGLEFILNEIGRYQNENS